jgi:hypothetical protein
MAPCCLCFQWLVKRSVETREEMGHFVQSFAVSQFNKLCPFIEGQRVLTQQGSLLRNILTIKVNLNTGFWLTSVPLHWGRFSVLTMLDVQDWIRVPKRSGNTDGSHWPVCWTQDAITFGPHLQLWNIKIFSIFENSCGSQDSSVGIATDCGLDNPGSIPGSARFFYSQYPDRLWGHPASYAMGTRSTFPRG